MASVLAFLSSLSLLGWVLVVLCILVIFNFAKILRLRSPLDSEQHKSWRSTGDINKAGHLEKKYKDI